LLQPILQGSRREPSLEANDRADQRAVLTGFQHLDTRDGAQGTDQLFTLSGNQSQLAVPTFLKSFPGAAQVQVVQGSPHGNQLRKRHRTRLEETRTQLQLVCTRQLEVAEPRLRRLNSRRNANETLHMLLANCNCRSNQ